MATQGNSGAAAGGQLEEKKDYTADTDAALTQAQTLVSSNQLADALVLLATVEKRCRVGNDTVNLARLCTAALQSCRDSGDPETLVTTLQQWTTKRSQKMAAVTALVTTAMPWCVVNEYEPLEVTEKAEIEARDALVTALRDVTDGKLYLERQRAQLTRALATIREAAGDTAGAADVLQEVHVETYGSLSKAEKIAFILEQLRLTIAKQDWVRAAIVAGKVNRKHLAELRDYKVRYFTMLATVHRHERDALALVQDYHAIYTTTLSQQQSDGDEDMDESKGKPDDKIWKEALQNTVVFLALSPHGNEQQDMLHRVSKDKNLEKLPAYRTTIQLLLKKEIINYPLAHQQTLESLPAFTEADLASHWHDTFFRRVIQHNIRTVSLYYTKIHGTRLAQLLQLEPARLESEIASMVSDGTVYAKIDRPADVVRFAKPQAPEAVLTDWAADIDTLLHLVETTTHLIHKEQMTSGTVTATSASA